MGGEIEVEPMITHTLLLEGINEAFDPMHGGESMRSAMAYQKPSPSMGEGWVGVWPLGLGMNANRRRAPNSAFSSAHCQPPNPALPPSRGKGSEWVSGRGWRSTTVGEPNKS